MYIYVMIRLLLFECARFQVPIINYQPGSYVGSVFDPSPEIGDDIIDAVVY
jgi:hypothetical protein